MYCGMSRATGVPWIVPRVCHGVDLGGGYEESGGGGNYGRRVPRVTVPGGRFLWEVGGHASPVPRYAAACLRHRKGGFPRETRVLNKTYTHVGEKVAY